MAISIIVSAKFVFGTDISVVTECSQEHMDFIREVNTLINMFVRLSVELPLYKLYDNKLTQEFRRAVDVSQ